jgi:hypothetical protein
MPAAAVIDRPRGEWSSWSRALERATSARGRPRTQNADSGVTFGRPNEAFAVAGPEVCACADLVRTFVRAPRRCWRRQSSQLFWHSTAGSRPLQLAEGVHTTVRAARRLSSCLDAPPALPLP